MDSIKKDTIVTKISERYTYHDLNDLEKFLQILQQEKNSGMKTMMFSTMSSFSCYDQSKWDLPCLLFLETREETDEEFQTRMKYEKELEEIDDKMNKIIERVCGYSEDNPHLLDGTERNNYDMVVYEYQMKCVEYSHQYDQTLCRLNDVGHMVFPGKKLSTKAFAYSKEAAARFLQKWTEKHPSTQNCPVSYRDTLNLPFQEIKAPKQK